MGEGRDKCHTPGCCATHQSACISYPFDSARLSFSFPIFPSTDQMYTLEHLILMWAGTWAAGEYSATMPFSYEEEEVLGGRRGNSSLLTPKATSYTPKSWPALAPGTALFQRPQALACLGCKHQRRTKGTSEDISNQLFPGTSCLLRTADFAMLPQNLPAGSCVHEPCYLHSTPSMH